MFTLYIVIILIFWKIHSTVQTGLQPDEIYFMHNIVQTEKYIIRLNECTNLKPAYVNRTWVINTNNNKCVQLYDQQNCTGNSIRLTPRSPFQDVLMLWDFEDKTQSVGICAEFCTPGLEQSIVSFQPNETPINITFYLQPNLKGKANTVPVLGCTSVDIPILSRERYKSIEIPTGTCILAFMSNYSDGSQIKGKSSNDLCMVHDYQHVLEIYDGAPALETLEFWYSNPMENIKAVAPCQCNYVRYPDPPEQDLGELSYVILYSDYNFQGKSISIPMNFEGCKDFAVNPTLAKWEGVAKSLYLADEGCVQVYVQKNCGDPSYLILTKSAPDLTEYNLALTVRSLSSCTPDNDDREPQKNASECQISRSNGFILVLVAFMFFINRM